MSSYLRHGSALLAASLLSPLSLAQLPTDCHDASISLQPTNWVSSMDVPRFDPALGILTSVTFELTGEVQGSAAVESLDALPSVVDTTYQATLTLTRPDNSVIVIATPNMAFSDPLTAFDGVIDFAGTSGITHGGIVATETEIVQETNPDWAQHIAMEVADVDALEAAMARLRGAGIDVLGPTDHGFIRSIYFYDPSGHRLELTCRTHQDGDVERFRSQAQAKLDGWSASKAG